MRLGVTVPKVERGVQNNQYERCARAEVEGLNSVAEYLLLR